MNPQSLPISLDITVRAVQGSNYNGALEVRESIQLGSLDFLQVCKVLARFHELAKELERK